MDKQGNVLTSKRGPKNANLLNTLSNTRSPQYGQNMDIRTSQQNNQLANIPTEQSYMSPLQKKGRHLSAEKIKTKHTDR